MTRFEPIVPNPDLDIHPDPQGSWSRVAVVCRWKDAHAFRKRWPEAAVVGPLRTVRGIDELVRNLLANPQIRVVVLDGKDLTPGEETTKALLATWGQGGHRATNEYLALDVQPHAGVVTNVSLVMAPAERPADVQVIPWLDGLGLNVDRPGGRVVLPPPPPAATAPAPHGDPGERVAADNLGELWPMVLHRAMRFGRLIPTQYGMTREVLNLVSVIRDPSRTLADLYLGTAGSPLVREASRRARNEVAGLPVAPVDTALDPGAAHPVLGITWNQVLAYHKRITSPEVPEGAPYSYGSRMHGCGQQATTVGDSGWGAMHTHEVVGTDQFERIRELLSTKPETRAAFLTPWREAEDSGKEGGRPCLVGAWFRAVPPTWKAEVDTDNRKETLSVKVSTDKPRHTLHLTVTFRSHDLFAGYPTNLAGICLWLVNTAEQHGMNVGTITCISFSAHVYERDWNAANAVITEHHDTATKPKWDQRSSWRVERVVEPLSVLPIEVGEEITSFGGDTWKVIARLDGDDDRYMLESPGGKTANVRADLLRKARGDHERQESSFLRATALNPDGTSVIATFEASTAEALRSKIERSGLCTSTGSALWLGDEIRRVAG